VEGERFEQILMKTLESWTLAPVKITESGKPSPSTRRWRLEPKRPRSTGLGPVSSPPFSPERWQSPTDVS